MDKVVNTRKATPMPAKLTTSSYISRCIETHGDRYDYSKTVYVNQKTKVTIVCKEHGEFTNTTQNHVSGSGCPKCRGSLKPAHTTARFISDAKAIHGDKYD